MTSRTDWLTNMGQKTDMADMTGWRAYKQIKTKPLMRTTHIVCVCEKAKGRPPRPPIHRPHQRGRRGTAFARPNHHTREGGARPTGSERLCPCGHTGHIGQLPLDRRIVARV